MHVKDSLDRVTRTPEAMSRLCRLIFHPEIEVPSSIIDFMVAEGTIPMLSLYSSLSLDRYGLRLNGKLSPGKEQTLQLRDVCRGYRYQDMTYTCRMNELINLLFLANTYPLTLYPAYRISAPTTDAMTSKPAYTDFQGTVAERSNLRRLAADAISKWPEELRFPEDRPPRMYHGKMASNLVIPLIRDLCTAIADLRDDVNGLEDLGWERYGTRLVSRTDSGPQRQDLYSIIMRLYFRADGHSLSEVIHYAPALAAMIFGQPLNSELLRQDQQAQKWMQGYTYFLESAQMLGRLPQHRGQPPSHPPMPADDEEGFIWLAYEDESRRDEFYRLVNHFVVQVISPAILPTAVALHEVLSQEI